MYASFTVEITEEDLPPKFFSFLESLNEQGKSYLVSEIMDEIAQQMSESYQESSFSTELRETIDYVATCGLPDGVDWSEAGL